MFVYDGLSLKGIAFCLNDIGILTPREYKIYKDILPKTPKAKIPSWHYRIIKVILSDEKFSNFAESKITEDDYAEHFKKYETITEITRDLLIDLIDKIFIYKIDSPCGNTSKQHKHIKVLFKFANEHK